MGLSRCRCVAAAIAWGAFGAAIAGVATLDATPPDSRDPLEALPTLAEPSSLTAAASGAAPAVRPRASEIDPINADRMLPLEVTVNGAKAGLWVFAQRAGELYATQEAFDEWRVNRPPGLAAFEVRGSPYFAISAVAGFRAQLDAESQSLALFFAPEAFAATRLLQARLPKLVLDPTLPSAFLNYDLNYNRSFLRAAPSLQNLGALGELGLSSGHGVATTSFVGRNLAGEQALGGRADWVRLESSFVRHLPESNQTLRLGDSITRGGMLGRQAYFGGIQFGSNYSLSPGFVTQPQPALGGLSSAPSTVELYVNDVLRQVSGVPTGPFALENLPVLTGQGEARLVVRDLLGRETVIVQSFFANPQLLAQGLSDWSVASGRLRRNLGNPDSSYGAAFGTGLWRYGVNNSLTLEGRAEATRRLRNASLGLVASLPWQTLGRAAFGASHADSEGSGRQWLLGFEKQDRHAGGSLQAQGASAHFSQLGQEVAAPRLQVAGNVSYFTESRGALGAGFASISSYATPLRGAQRVSTASLNYAVKVADRASLNFTLSKVFSEARGTAIGVTLVMPLSGKVISTASLQRRGSEQDFLATASMTPDLDQPLAWRLLAGRQREVNRAEGGLYYTGRYGQLSGDLSSSSNQTAVRLGAMGALVLADSHVFATSRIDDSFAVVELAGYPDVGVGLGSAMQTRTNSQGLALLSRLVPYQENAIRLDPSEVPLGAELESLEKIGVPRQRSAVKIVFPVRTGRAALLRIVMDDAEPAPAGATVSLAGQSEVFYVARRGEVFVTGLQASNRLVLTWQGRRCLIEASLPAPSAEEVVRIGPLNCKAGGA
jgi:outer membrane usher protein